MRASLKNVATVGVPVIAAASFLAHAVETFSENGPTRETGKAVVNQTRDEIIFDLNWGDTVTGATPRYSDEVGRLFIPDSARSIISTRDKGMIADSEFATQVREVVACVLFGSGFHPVLQESHTEKAQSRVLVHVQDQARITCSVRNEEGLRFLGLERRPEGTNDARSLVIIGDQGLDGNVDIGVRGDRSELFNGENNPENLRDFYTRQYRHAIDMIRTSTQCAQYWKTRGASRGR